jgi:heme A synthase
MQLIHTTQNNQGGLFADHAGFVRLAFAAAFVTFLMINLGAVTRVTESGFGCGSDWPHCNGKIIPEFTDMTVVLEYGHRLFALLVGAFSGAVAWRAWRLYRNIPRIFIPAQAAFALFFVQSALGAFTVKMYDWDLYRQWMSVVLHLGTSLVLLATGVIVWINARSLSPGDTLHAVHQAPRMLPPMQLYAITLMSFFVFIVGAAVAGSDAAKACGNHYPLCFGEVWPAEQGPLQTLHMFHRIVAGGLGLLMLALALQARQRVHVAVRNAVMAAVLTYLAQSALGASVVFIDNREWLTLSRSLHVTFAALLWAAMITASAISWLQLLPKPVTMPQNQIEPKAAPGGTILR